METSPNVFDLYEAVVIINWQLTSQDSQEKDPVSAP